MYLEELEESARSALLGADDDDVGQSTSSRRRRHVAVAFSVLVVVVSDCPIFTRPVTDAFLHVAGDAISCGNGIREAVRRRDKVDDGTRLPERRRVPMT